MVVKLLIDSREPDIFHSFAIPENCELHCTALAVGDFQFMMDDDPVILVERKTVNDYHASIRDGRLREQKARILSLWPSTRVIYLVEGDLRRNSGRGTARTLVSSILNTMFRDNIQVFHTQNIAETIFVMTEILYKLEKQGLTFMDAVSTEERAAKYEEEQARGLVSVKKSDNLTAGAIYKGMLCCVPGVSAKTADSIIAQYPSMRELMEGLRVRGTSFMSEAPGRKLSGKVINSVILSLG